MTLQSSKTGFSGHLRGASGKGTLGCVFFLALLGVAIFAAMRIGPPWFAYKGLESDFKTEVARAGAHVFTDETIIKELIAVAEKNDVELSRENISIRRFADQLEIAIHYTVTIDLLVYQRDWDFEIKSSSFIGRL
jgi:hypothetical protein